MYKNKLCKFDLVLWFINDCRLFKAKSIFINIEISF